MMKRALSLIFIFTFLIFSGCSSSPEIKPTPTPTINAGSLSGRAPDLSPYGTASFDELIAFINTVDQNTFEDGAFKSIIERVREEGYILRPCFDSSYSTVADRSPNSSVYVEPYYPTPNFPPQFMYHLEDNGFMYRINVIYIDEAYIDAADEDGYMGYKNYRDGDTSGAWKKTEEYDRISHKTVRIDGKNRNVTFYTDPTQNTVTGYFVWEKYLIKVNGEIKSEDISEYAFCNTELLKHLSFKKLPLDQ